MPKMKTTKSAADRFKISGTGKVIRRKTGIRHLKMAKAKSTLRRSKVPQVVTGVMAKKIKRLLAV